MIVIIIMVRCNVPIKNTEGALNDMNGIPLLIML